jgi:hypothetical protein
MEVAVQLVALSDGGAEETLMLGTGVDSDALFTSLRTPM